MFDSPYWYRSRGLALGCVVLLHAAILSLAWRSPNAPRGRPESPISAVHLVFLPPLTYPKLKLQIAIARQLGGNAAITVATPRLDGTTDAAAPGPLAAASGSRDGVDWAAEARRELQALEIRRNRNPGINTVSMRVGEDYWMVHAEHFPEDELKTANGDWIVWVNDYCYQIATAAAPRESAAAGDHPTICREPNPEGSKRTQP